MSHAVIEFQCFGDDAYQTVLRFPSGIEGVGRAYPWVVPNEAAFADLASEQADGVASKAGDELLASLLTNPSIRRCVSALVTLKSPCGIYFEAQPGAEAADELPWEALREAGKFLALESWPIGRMQTCELGNYPKIDYDFFTPVKVMAVLSAPAAAGNSVPAQSEWRALLETLTEAQNRLRQSWNLDGDALQLLVFASEDDLIAEIQDAIRDPRMSWITVKGIADKQQLLREKAEFRPHVLHIFGHGGAVGDPVVRVGTRRDWVLEKDGSVQISPADLFDEADILWLVTLNCCSGAANVGGANSFAKLLVRGGVPAAIGMREPINGKHAQAICLFYNRVLSSLAELRVGQPPQEIDLASALISVRESLHKNCDELILRRKLHPANCKHWTLPVLYRRAGGFRVQRRPPRTLDGVELVAKKATLAQKRVLLVSLNDTGALTEVIAKMDSDIAEIERRLAQ